MLNLLNLLLLLLTPTSGIADYFGSKDLNPEEQKLNRYYAQLYYNYDAQQRIKIAKSICDQPTGSSILLRGYVTCQPNHSRLKKPIYTDESQRNHESSKAKELTIQKEEALDPDLLQALYFEVFQLFCKTTGKNKTDRKCKELSQKTSADERVRVLEKNRKALEEDFAKSVTQSFRNQLGESHHPDRRPDPQILNRWSKQYLAFSECAQGQGGQGKSTTGIFSLERPLAELIVECQEVREEIDLKASHKRPKAKTKDRHLIPVLLRSSKIHQEPKLTERLKLRQAEVALSELYHSQDQDENKRTEQIDLLKERFEGFKSKGQYFSENEQNRIQTAQHDLNHWSDQRKYNPGDPYFTGFEPYPPLLPFDVESPLITPPSIQYSPPTESDLSREKPYPEFDIEEASRRSTEDRPIIPPGEIQNVMIKERKKYLTLKYPGLSDQDVDLYSTQAGSEGGSVFAYFIHDRIPEGLQKTPGSKKLKSWLKSHATEVLKIVKTDQEMIHQMRQQINLWHLYQSEAHRFKYSDQDSKLKSIVRAGEFLDPDAHLRQGRFVMKAVHGIRADKLKARFKEAASGNPTANHEMISLYKFKNLADVQQKLMVLEEFYRRTHDPILKWIQSVPGYPVRKNVLFDTRLNAKGGPSESAPVGFDYNHGTNVIWNPDEQIFIAIDF